MVATLTLDTLTSSGAGITIPAGKTLTVEGVSVTAGSSNIQRAIADVDMKTDAGYEVSGKSEVVVAANAGSGNRTITLPDTTAVGMSTCLITVVADADAGAGFHLKVQDQASAEVWTGVQTGDFVRLIVSNGAWLVVDHKETYFASFYLTADQSLASNTTAQLTGITEIKDIGSMWDSINDRVIVPTGMNGWFDISVMSAIGANYPPVGPAYKISGVWKGLFNWGGTLTDQYCANTGFAGGREPVTSAQYFEAWGWNKQSNAAFSLSGGEAGKTHFNVIFTRTY